MAALRSLTALLHPLCQGDDRTDEPLRMFEPITTYALRDPAGEHSPNQRLVETDQALCASCIATATAAAHELSIDTARTVNLAADDMQAADARSRVRNHDVGASTGHVCSHRDLSRLARRGDYGSFMLVLPRVEHAMRQRGLRKKSRKLFGLQNGISADQHRTSGGRNRTRLLEHRFPLSIAVGIHACRK